MGKRESDICNMCNHKVDSNEHILSECEMVNALLQKVI